MDTMNKEWNIKVDFITFYKFSVTAIEIWRGIGSGFEMIRENWLAETDSENINTIIAGFNECFEAKE